MITDTNHTNAAISCNSDSASKKLSIKLSKVPAKSIVTSSKLSILDDHTSKESQQIKLWEDEAKQRQEGKAPPLVIPVVTTREGDVEAVKELEREALNLNDENNTHSTNFSSQGSIIINDSSKPKKTLLLQSRLSPGDNDEQSITESEQFLKDVSHRPEELAPTDLAYRAVPVHEFGAALLRGMGWKGDDPSKAQTKNTIDDTFIPKLRHHRLGLGATLAPIISSSSVTKKEHIISKQRHFATKSNPNPENNGSEARDKTERKPEEVKTESKMQQLKRQQSSLCDGSIVYVQHEGETEGGRRAVVLQASGVPGLNRIRLQYEGDQGNFITSKDRVKLISHKTLELDPFLYGNNDQDNSNISSRVEPMPSGKRKRENERVYNQLVSEKGDLEENKRGDGSCGLERDKFSSEMERRGNKALESDYQDYSKRNGNSSKYKEHERFSKDLDESQKLHYYQQPHIEKQRYKREDRRDQFMEQEHHWLIPNIRVRVISQKIGGGRYYKNKGIVVDTSQPGQGTLQMDSGKVLLESVKQKYLETALPKRGGCVIILKGRNKYQRGTLLERNSNTCKGVVQLQENMDVVSIPLDDIAEWCGSLHDDDLG